MTSLAELGVIDKSQMASGRYITASAMSATKRKALLRNLKNSREARLNGSLVGGRKPLPDFDADTISTAMKGRPGEGITRSRATGTIRTSTKYGRFGGNRGFQANNSAAINEYNKMRRQQQVLLGKPNASGKVRLITSKDPAEYQGKTWGAVSTKTGGRRSKGNVFGNKALWDTNRGVYNTKKLNEYMRHERGHLTPNRSGWRLSQILASPSKLAREEARVESRKGLLGALKRGKAGSQYTNNGASDYDISALTRRASGNNAKNDREYLRARHRLAERTGGQTNFLTRKIYGA